MQSTSPWRMRRSRTGWPLRNVPLRLERSAHEIVAGVVEDQGMHPADLRGGQAKMHAHPDPMTRHRPPSRTCRPTSCRSSGLSAAVACCELPFLRPNPGLPAHAVLTGSRP